MTRVAYIRSDNIYADSRATKEINALLEFGYNVDVYGWDDSNYTIEKCKEVFRNKNIKFHFYRGSKVKAGFLHKLISFIGWIHYATLGIKRERYDIIHACDLDCGIIARNSGTPYIYDIYDYFVDSHSLNVLAKKVFERLEIGVINNSVSTIICTEERRIQIQKANPKRIVVIYNSPDICNEDDYTGEIQCDYAYCGTLGESRLLKEIIDDHAKQADLRFIFAGNGTYSQLAQKTADSDENFEYVGTIPYNRVLEIEKSAIVISAIYNPITRNNQLCAPNKFYEALALGKPVIVCKDTGIDKVVEKYKLGIVINYSSDEFYQALRFLKNNPVICREMGETGKKLYASDFAWTKSKNKLQILYKELTPITYEK